MSGIRTQANLLSASLERMIAIQQSAYPDHWTREEKREMARRELGICEENEDDE